jgi:hypothetical protein
MLPRMKCKRHLSIFPVRPPKSGLGQTLQLPQRSHVWFRQEQTLVSESSPLAKLAPCCLC